MKEKSVGIIANPASGKDIRRIVTYSTPYDNQEKVNIVRRILMALHATGVRKIYYMPEYYNIVPLAASGVYGEHKKIMEELEFEALDFMYMEKEIDTIRAGRLMTEIGVDVVITLGGDGTNRAFCREGSQIPMVPVSTGTNNVFPTMVEGTLAGLAAGIVAMGVCDDHPEVFHKRKKLSLYVNGVHSELALIDLVVLDAGLIGARAMWKDEGIQELFVTECSPHNIGISAIPGQLMTITDTEPKGMRVKLGESGTGVHASIAPGIILPIQIAESQEIVPGEKYPIASPSLIAVDGERNFMVKEGDEAYVVLETDGPVVIDIDRALQIAQDKAFFRF